MTVRLSSLSAREDGKVSVSFELREGEHCQRESFLIPWGGVADLSLQVGECSEDCYEAVAEYAALEQAVEKGIRSIGYGTVSAGALCRKLTAKGVKPSVAREAVEQLKRRGYLDEGAEAIREAERCVEKLWGRRRIVATLQSKGYPSEVIRAAMESLEDGGVDFSALCAERIQRKTGGVPTDLGERRKWTASLIRYGFSGAEIREAVRSLSE